MSTRRTLKLLMHLTISKIISNTFLLKNVLVFLIDIFFISVMKFNTNKFRTIKHSFVNMYSVGERNLHYFWPNLTLIDTHAVLIFLHWANVYKTNNKSIWRAKIQRRLLITCSGDLFLIFLWRLTYFSGTTAHFFGYNLCIMSQVCKLASLHTPFQPCPKIMEQILGPDDHTTTGFGDLKSFCYKFGSFLRVIVHVKNPFVHNFVENVLR